MSILVVVLALLCGLLGACSGFDLRDHPITDALIPDEMSFDYHRGRLDGKEWDEPLNPSPVPPTATSSSSSWSEPDQDLYWFGISFTWHLRKDERRELRAILEELRRRRGPDRGDS